MAESVSPTVDVDAVRARFSSLQTGFAFFDAPGGSQVPDEVGDAIARALREASANLGAGLRDEPARQGDPRGGREQARCRGSSAASRRGHVRTEHDVAQLHAVADGRAGRSPPATRSSSRRWTTTAASRRGSSWRTTGISSSSTSSCCATRRLTTTTSLSKLASGRVRVVAFAWASNAIGTIVDAARVCSMAHDAGALAWVDAVHYAAHEPIDVRAVDADVLICSPYKYCGPHLGVAYGRASVLGDVAALQGPPGAEPSARAAGSRPARSRTSCSPASTRRSTTSTRSAASRRSCRTSARSAQRFLDAVSDARDASTGCRGWRAACRRSSSTSTESPRPTSWRIWPSLEIGVWAHDSWYSLDLYKRLGYEKDAIRIGFIHYNTVEEVDRLVAGLMSSR